MHHVIRVSLEPADAPAGDPDVRVVALPNRQECRPGDTVEWDLGSIEDAEELRIEFGQVLGLPGDKPLDSEVVHVFTGEPAAGAGRITGTVRADVVPGRVFTYRIFRGDDRLAWENPMSATQDFAGLEIPPPPPRG